MIVVYLACIIVGLLAYLAQITWKRYKYWEVRNVPHLKPSLFFGNFKDYLFLKDEASSIEKKICQQFPNEPYVGVFYGTEPTLIVQDAELIGLITSKEFNSFNGREISNYCYKEIITNSIFYVFGERWKACQQTLTPIFTASRLKNMFHIIENCASDLEKMLQTEIKVSSTMDVRQIMASYTMDCICACVLGVNANTMSSTDEMNPFKIMGQKIFQVSPMRNFTYIIRSMWPALYYGLGFKVFPEELNEFFLKLYKDVSESRQYKPSSRQDLVDYLLSTNKNDEMAIGLLVSLFGAGYETSANTLSLTLFELAKNEEIQNRARKEVDEYLQRNKGKITYECVNELPYLYACGSEAIRLYPVLGVVTREVMQDYQLPTGLKLEKGIRIHFPISHIHRNPDHFPEPNQYRPERFLNDTIKPYTFLPFGEGRRQCIGKRFAKMQMLPCLVTVLKNYRLELAENMSTTMQFEVGSIITQPKGEILVKFIPREETTL
ncbi:cytochrome P450 6B7-like [Epargyreus clarus]|uniref:cytochrome P450 6B7-like n=1 Tax=Epargyreus clarus TaxID=520877 RepID=UPI003C2DA1EA